MKEFISCYNQFFYGDNSNLIWHNLCTHAGVVKNVRECTSGEMTMTERTVRADAGHLKYHGRRFRFVTGYVQFLEFVDCSVVAYPAITLSLSNAGYVPVDNDEYFVVGNTRPCKALLIFEEGEQMSGNRVKALMRDEEELSWIGWAANAFLKTFG